MQVQWPSQSLCVFYWFTILRRLAAYLSMSLLVFVQAMCTQVHVWFRNQQIKKEAAGRQVRRSRRSSNKQANCVCKTSPLNIFSIFVTIQERQGLQCNDDENYALWGDVPSILSSQKAVTQPRQSSRELDALFSSWKNRNHSLNRTPFGINPLAHRGHKKRHSQSVQVAVAIGIRRLIKRSRDR